MRCELCKEEIISQRRDGELCIYECTKGHLTMEMLFTSQTGSPINFTSTPRPRTNAPRVNSYRTNKSKTTVNTSKVYSRTKLRQVRYTCLFYKGVSEDKRKRVNKAVARQQTPSMNNRSGSLLKQWRDTRNVDGESKRPSHHGLSLTYLTYECMNIPTVRRVLNLRRSSGAWVPRMGIEQDMNYRSMTACTLKDMRVVTTHLTSSFMHCLWPCLPIYVLLQGARSLFKNNRSFSLCSPIR